MIRAVTFDLDGVYFLHGKARFLAALVERGVSEAEAKRVFLQSDEMNLLYKRGQMTDDAFWRWALAEWRLNMSVPEVIELLMQGYEVNPPVVEALRRIKASGCKILACTNNFPARIHGLHARFGFLDDFDVRVLSYEVGMVKPAPEMFQLLIERSGVDASSIVFADDHAENVRVAASLGIQALTYQDVETFFNQLKELGLIF